MYVLSDVGIAYYRAPALRRAMGRQQTTRVMEIAATRNSPMVNPTTRLDMLEQGVYSN